MAKSTNACPEGTLCLNTETICIFTVIVIGVLCVYIYMLHTRQQSDTSYSDSNPLETTYPQSFQRERRNPNPPEIHISESSTYIEPPATPSRSASSSIWATDMMPTTHPAMTAHAHTQSAPQVTTNIYQSTNYTDPMLQPPLRMSPNTARVNMMPINIETRGTAPEMQQVGTLRSKSNDTILALYGRPTFRGSSKWVYYTATDKFHSIKLPVEKNKRDCTSEHGCDELYEDDEVRVKGYDSVFQTSVYQLDAPRYIPYIA